MPTLTLYHAHNSSNNLLYWSLHPFNFVFMDIHPFRIIMSSTNNADRYDSSIYGKDVENLYASDLNAALEWLLEGE